MHSGGGGGTAWQLTNAGRPKVKSNVSFKDTCVSSLKHIVCEKDSTLSGNMSRTKELLIESTFTQGTSFGKKRVTVLSTTTNCLHSNNEDQILPCFCGAPQKKTSKVECFFSLSFFLLLVPKLEFRRLISLFWFIQKKNPSKPEFFPLSS